MSMLDGASPVEDYIAYARENSHPICSCTDHGWLTGVYDLVNRAHEVGVRPVPGCEFYLQPHPDHKFAGKEYEYFHLTVWASNQAGLKNLIELGSKSWEGDQPITRWGKAKPRVTWANLRDHSEGLIVGSGCIEGPIGKCLLQGEMEQAWINARMLKDIFGDRLFFELMPAKVDRDYVKGLSVVVRGKNGIIYRFMPDDILVTEDGEMTAAEACGKRPTEVLFVKPSRIQDGPVGGDVIQENLIDCEIDDAPAHPPPLPTDIYASS
jgi:DNA polymerase III alpha subunit